MRKINFKVKIKINNGLVIRITTSDLIRYVDHLHLIYDNSKKIYALY